MKKNEYPTIGQELFLAEEKMIKKFLVVAIPVSSNLGSPLFTLEQISPPPKPYQQYRKLWAHHLQPFCLDYFEAEKKLVKSLKGCLVRRQKAIKRLEDERRSIMVTLKTLCP